MGRIYLESGDTRPPTEMLREACMSESLLPKPDPSLDILVREGKHLPSIRSPLSSKFILFLFLGVC